VLIDTDSSVAPAWERETEIDPDPIDRYLPSQGSRILMGSLRIRECSARYDSISAASIWVFAYLWQTKQEESVKLN
jgi:hypothetical protein